MTKLFLTGDRSFSPIYPGLVVVQMFKAALRGDKVMTGDNPGVEQLVRDIAAEVGLDIEVVATSFHAVTGKPGWDVRHKQLADAGDIKVMVFHVEPMASSVVKSVMAVMPEDRYELLTPVELLG